MASKRLEAAISKLADCFEHGHLQAQSDPAAFIEHAADEVTRLRSENAELRQQLENATGYAEDWRARAEAAEAREAGLRDAIESALVLSADRARFVMMGPMAHAQVESVLRRALAGEKDGA